MKISGTSLDRPGRKGMWPFKQQHWESELRQNLNVSRPLLHLW